MYCTWMTVAPCTHIHKCQQVSAINTAACAARCAPCLGLRRLEPYDKRELGDIIKRHPGYQHIGKMLDHVEATENDPVRKPCIATLRRGAARSGGVAFARLERLPARERRIHEANQHAVARSPARQLCSQGIQATCGGSHDSELPHTGSGVAPVRFRALLRSPSCAG